MLRYLLLALLISLPIITMSAQDTGNEEAELPQITIPISIYLLVDDIENPDPEVSTSRTEEELLTILANMNAIWSQTNIELSLTHVSYVEIPKTILEDIIVGNFTSFFASVNNNTILIPEVTLINGFYVKDIGGPNGITLSSQVYFVNDNPTVHDERVSSHEVGHMLGLHHNRLMSGQLMFSGTNGTILTEEEVVVARYFAQGFLDGVRR